MNSTEKKLRDTPLRNKKYLKRLSDYVRELMIKGRIIEAKYYFSKLYALKPSHLKTQIIGYELAIKTFDNQSVLLFDKVLTDQKYDEQSLLSQRLKYYYSVNNTKHFSELVQHFLSLKSMKPETLELVVHLAFTQDAYLPVALVTKYLKSNNRVLHKSIESRLKPIVLKKLVDTIVESKR